MNEGLKGMYHQPENAFFKAQNIHEYRPRARPQKFQKGFKKFTQMF